MKCGECEFWEPDEGSEQGTCKGNWATGFCIQKPYRDSGPCMIGQKYADLRRENNQLRLDRDGIRNSFEYAKLANEELKKKLGRSIEEIANEVDRQEEMHYWRDAFFALAKAAGK